MHKLAYQRIYDARYQFQAFVYRQLAAQHPLPCSLCCLHRICEKPVTPYTAIATNHVYVWRETNSTVVYAAGQPAFPWHMVPAGKGMQR